MSIEFDQMNQLLTSFEKGLNVVGYVPIVSTISGSVRLAYGKLEAIVAIAAIAFHFMAGLIGIEGSAEKLRAAVPYVLHGFANMGRGLVEILPFINLTCYLYDQTQPGYSYPSLTSRAVVPVG